MSGGAPFCGRSFTDRQCAREEEHVRRSNEASSGYRARVQALIILVSTVTEPATEEIKYLVFYPPPNLPADASSSNSPATSTDDKQEKGERGGPQGGSREAGSAPPLPLKRVHLPSRPSPCELSTFELTVTAPDTQLAVVFPAPASRGRRAKSRYHSRRRATLREAKHARTEATTTGGWRDT